MDRTLTLNNLKYNKLLLLTVLIIGLLLLLPNTQVLASEIGGYVSEKLVDRSGVNSAQLVIGMGNPQIDIGMGPAVSTLPAQTTPAKDTATLRGGVDSLNNFPNVVVWFEWGYNTSYGNATPTQIATSTGTYTADISNFNLAQTVHYRFCASADGTNCGSDNPFSVPHTPAGALGWLIPVVFAIFGIVVLFALRGNPIAIIIAGILIVIGVLILANVAGGLW